MLATRKVGSEHALGELFSLIERGADVYGVAGHASRDSAYLRFIQRRPTLFGIVSD